MRVPLSWLAEYVDFEWDVDELAARLTMLGMEVQAIERIGEDWQQVVVGRLLEVSPHPQAERLSLTRVEVGAGEPLAIVCGATNIAVGQHVPVALPGAVLPGARRIETTSIQGAQSQGMLCSGAELGLTGDADGILILGSDGTGPPLGTPLQEVVGEKVIDVDVKPNRGDALSLIGLAREVAALTGGRVRWPQISVPERGDATADHLSVSVEAPDLCPRFVGRYVDELRVGPSPLTVQLRLAAAGMRPVSNVVDASNYVMLELGKPIHNFDAAAVDAGRLVVRRATEGERIETLDHVARTLSADTLLIADATGALGIAGVMGGAGSEVGEGTSAVIVESAIFDAVSIRRTAQRYSLRSEASQRFERGQEWQLARLGADRTAQLLAEWAGGRPAVGVVDSNPSEPAARRVTFRPARVNRLLGTELAASQMADLLARAEIETQPANGERVPVVTGESPLAVTADADSLTAIVPPHRRDIEIEADVAEEVARLHGYGAIPALLPASPTPAYRPDPRRFIDGLRELLAGRGLTEVLTHVLIAPEDHARLGLPADAATIRLANPVTADRSEMRRSLLPGLLGGLVANERRRREDVAIFEVGPIHAYVDGEPWQADRLGLLLAGDWHTPSWTQSARPADLEDAKGVIEWLIERAARRRVSYRAATALAGVEHPHRTAEVIVDGEAVTVIGRVGEIDPRLLRAYETRAERILFASLDVARLMGVTETARVESPARLPAVERDIAVVVGEDVSHAAVAELIRVAAGAQLAELTLFDRYQGPPLGRDEVSLAYRLRFQPTEAPIGEAELEELLGNVGRALSEGLGARIRGHEQGRAG
jgi:phenylalanyl-tRNA synthetase beta chain